MERFDFSFSPEFLKSYRPIRLLGQGAMGSVHLMHHLRFDLPVAVKFIRSEGFSETERARFEREARVLGALDHPNIMSVLDMGVDGRNPYLVCEFVDGGSLADRIHRGPRLTGQQSLKIVAQLLSALKAAHQKDIIHRDVKPANVFLTSNLKVKLGDFGLAKPLQAPPEEGHLTVTGAIVGTPPYMSPEQCRGLTATAASDLYSVGVVLYELLTGSRPFRGPGLLEYLLQHTSHEAALLRSIRPDLPAELEDLVKRALAKKPERRPAGAHEFRREVLGVARLLPSPAAARDGLLNGRYRLERPIGEGWLGQVYLARDEELKATVAVKTVRPVLWRDRHVQALLKRAANANERLTHEGIVRILRVEQDAADPESGFIVTAFVDGPSLEQELERRSTEGSGPLGAEEALPLVTSIAGALSQAHRAGQLHTALRPSNVVLEEPVALLRARVTDFGIDPRGSAESTQSPTVTSTAIEAYMSPEQRAGGPLDERSDVYSLGVLVHRVLGEASGGLTPQMVELLARARSREKKDRPASVDEFLALYRAALPADPPVPPTILFAPRARFGGPLLAAGAVVVVLLVAWSSQRAPPPVRDDPVPTVTSPAPVSAEPVALVTPSPPRATATPAPPADAGKGLEQYVADAKSDSAKAQSEAMRWLRQASDQGNVQAQYELAVLLEASGRPADSGEAGARLMQAADGGNVKAQVKLGRSFLSGVIVLRRPDRAVEWFRKAAAAGDAAAQWNLAELLASGTGVLRNDTEALRWYRAAAAQGDPLGQCGVGLMYESGRGVASDPGEAFLWYEQAAKKGHPAGLYHVGLCHLNGVGVATSERTAIEHLARAAELGHAPAELALGRIYLKTDLDKARTWMKRAADRDDAEAQFFLARMYLEGQDRDQAVRWFKKAEKQGHAGARAWLEANGDPGR